jgi:GDPmannose 4,6-dehydratase
VIGTGENHSVREFVEQAFMYAGAEIEWKGEGTGEKGIIKSLTLPSPLKVGDVVIEIDPRYFRPTEVENLLADASKARETLGWEPKVTFGELVKIMVDADMELVGLAPPGEGKKILAKKGINWATNTP